MHVAGLVDRRSPVNIVHLCDVDPSHIRRKEFTGKIADFQQHAPRETGDPHEVLDNKDVDAVIVATPHHWHAPIVQAALAADKDVYCEKPLSHAFAEGRRVIDAVKKSDRILQHGSQMRSSPVTKLAGQLLADGVIGEVKVTKAWNVQDRTTRKVVADSDPPANDRGGRKRVKSTATRVTMVRGDLCHCRRKFHLGNLGSLSPPAPIRLLNAPCRVRSAGVPRNGILIPWEAWAMFTKLRTLVLVLRNREFVAIFHELRRRFWSTEVSFCLSRDLTVPFEPPQAHVPFTIRELQAADHPEVLRERPRRLPILSRNVPTCYVAAADSGEICFIQWLISSASNDAIRQIFGNRVPPLAPDKALLEYGYTFAAWRGKNVMSRAVALISERAIDLGCRHVMTFVRQENVPALKGCQRAGFHMHRRQTVTWRLFVRVAVATTDLPPGTRYPYETAAQTVPPDLPVA